MTNHWICPILRSSFVLAVTNVLAVLLTTPVLVLAGDYQVGQIVYLKVKPSPYSPHAFDNLPEGVGAYESTKINRFDGPKLFLDVRSAKSFSSTDVRTSEQMLLLLTREISRDAMNPQLYRARRQVWQEAGKYKYAIVDGTHAIDVLWKVSSSGGPNSSDPKVVDAHFKRVATALWAIPSELYERGVCFGGLGRKEAMDSCYLEATNMGANKRFQMLYNQQLGRLLRYLVDNSGDIDVTYEELMATPGLWLDFHEGRRDDAVNRSAQLNAMAVLARAHRNGLSRLLMIPLKQADLHRTVSLEYSQTANKAMRDGKRALAFGKRAKLMHEQLSPRAKQGVGGYPMAVASPMVAAYVELGDFEKAAIWQEMVVEYWATWRFGSERERIARKDLAAYRSGRKPTN